jgi:Tfp pilus assembly protein PilX
MRAHSSVDRQHGASLIIAMVFLVIMAMMGITVANVTS